MKADSIKQAKRRVDRRRQKAIRIILLLIGVFLIGVTAGSTACILVMLNCA